MVLAAIEANETEQIPGPNTNQSTHKVHSNLKTIKEYIVVTVNK